MGLFDKAAQSILRSDRAKAAAFGGQLLGDVKDITADEETATLTIEFRAGSETAKKIGDDPRIVAMVGKYGDRINNPGKKYTTAPADVHDAVKATIFDALGIDEKFLHV